MPGFSAAVMETWQYFFAAESGAALMSRILRGELQAGDPAVCYIMTFINSAIDMLKVLVIAIGCGLAVWGVINLLEGYGNDNPGAKSQGIKQLMAGGGIALIGMQLIPLLANLFATP